MRILDRSFLRGVFALGLGACGGARPTPPTTTPAAPPVNPLIQAPHAITWASLPPEAKGEIERDAVEFHATDLRAPGALPFELVAIVDQVSVPSTGKYAAHEPVCDPDPCTPEIEALEKSIFGRAIAVRTGTGLTILRAEELPPLLGAIDSPAKAAIVAAAHGRDSLVPTKCTALHRIEAACAEGETAEGIAVRAIADGYEVLVHGERNVCGPNQHGDGTAFGIVKVNAKGEVSFHSDAPIAKWTAAAAMPTARCRSVSRGRMHEHHVAGPEARSLDDYLALACREEAAAALAFERLAEELTAFGAPAELVAAARRGVDEEREHARLFAELAALPPPVASAQFTTRSLFALLVENAREGCANETYAAIVATHQAEHAPPELRATFQRIAEDERAHAALAFAIDAWGRTRLDAAQGAELDAAHARACTEMRAASPSRLAAAFGEPPAALAIAAFDHVTRELARAARQISR